MTNLKKTFTIPKEIITLPSRGVLYSQDSILHSGQLQMRYPTAKDQDILSSSSLIRKGVMIDQFIKSLIVNTKINYNQLLTFDRDKLLFASRILAYTNIYEAIITCPSCQHKNNTKIDLQSLQQKVLAEDITQNKFIVQLPRMKVQVALKFLTVQQQNELSKQIQSLAKIRQVIDGATPQISTRLKKMIVSVDGNSQQQVISQFVDNYMPASDSLQLRRVIKEITPGVVNEFNFTCQKCGYQKEMVVPLTAQFFYPDLAQ